MWLDSFTEYNTRETCTSKNCSVIYVWVLCMHHQVAAMFSCLHRVVTAILCNGSHILYAFSFGSNSPSFFFWHSNHLCSRIRFFQLQNVRYRIQSNLSTFFESISTYLFIWNGKKKSRFSLSTTAALLNSVSLGKRQCSVSAMQEKKRNDFNYSMRQLCWKANFLGKAVCVFFHN